MYLALACDMFINAPEKITNQTFKARFRQIRRRFVSACTLRVDDFGSRFFPFSSRGRDVVKPTLRANFLLVVQHTAHGTTPRPRCNSQFARNRSRVRATPSRTTHTCPGQTRSPFRPAHKAPPFSAVIGGGGVADASGVCRHGGFAAVARAVIDRLCVISIFVFSTFL